MTKFIKISGISFILGSIILMLSWFMIFILLFDKIMNQNWIEMVNNNIWIILNSGLFISIFFI